ncbi:response regulator [Desulfobacula sp.]|uniref:response regulator n=1 Tax=Desulfobacula sp. TaxID=2593537 RepID=UPI002608A5C8|nr:response regulator [Desulfobacula sp.]
MKVILVDDEKKFINMLAKRLALRGIQADAVFSGEDAIKKVSNKAYDVAVLDIKMPGISGIQLKKKLSILDPGLKYIFVTGHGTVSKSDEDLIQKDFYLSKPLDIEILIKRMNEIGKLGL